MSEKIARSADVLNDILKKSPPLRQLVAQDFKVQEAITDGLTEYLPTPTLVGNATIYIIVVASIGLVAVAAVIGAIVLAYGSSSDKAVPETITALGSAAIGALAGLLAPSPSRK